MEVQVHIDLGVGGGGVHDTLITDIFVIITDTTVVTCINILSNAINAKLALANVCFISLFCSSLIQVSLIISKVNKGWIGVSMCNFFRLTPTNLFQVWYCERNRL